MRNLFEWFEIRRNSQALRQFNAALSSEYVNRNGEYYDIIRVIRNTYQLLTLRGKYYWNNRAFRRKTKFSLSQYEKMLKEFEEVIQLFMKSGFSVDIILLFLDSVQMLRRAEKILYKEEAMLTEILMERQEVLWQLEDKLNSVCAGGQGVFSKEQIADIYRTYTVYNQKF